MFGLNRIKFFLQTQSEWRKRRGGEIVGEVRNRVRKKGSRSERISSIYLLTFSRNTGTFGDLRFVLSLIFYMSLSMLSNKISFFFLSFVVVLALIFSKAIWICNFLNVRAVCAVRREEHEVRSSGTKEREYYRYWESSPTTSSKS